MTGQLKLKSGGESPQPTVHLSTSATLSLASTTLPIRKGHSNTNILTDSHFVFSIAAPSTSGKDMLLLLENDYGFDFTFSPADVRLLISIVNSIPSTTVSDPHHMQVT